MNLISQKKQSWRGSPTFSYALALFTFLIWGTSFTAGKFISPTPFSPIIVTFYRTVIGALTIFCILAIKGQLTDWFYSFRKFFWQILAIGVLLYAMAFFMEYWSLSRTESSNQAVLSNTMIFWVVIINTIFYKQKPTKNFLVGLILAISGVMLILISDEFNFSNVTLPGDLGTLVAYFIWGAYSAFTAKINEQMNPLFTTLSVFLSSLILLLPIAIINGGLEAICGLSSINWIALLYLGIFCGGIAFYTYNLALSNKRISSEYIVIFSLINPIIGTIAGVFLLHETLFLREVIGICLILVAITVANKNPRYRHVTGKEFDGTNTSGKA
ncbi:MAG: DMT family transporter [Candidatus Lokiarchaeota archaeon]|nr:DMT family transporter [Candidatus Harpocratesius repetitus]